MTWRHCPTSPPLPASNNKDGAKQRDPKPIAMQFIHAATFLPIPAFGTSATSQSSLADWLLICAPARSHPPFSWSCSPPDPCGVHTLLPVSTRCQPPFKTVRHLSVLPDRLRRLAPAGELNGWANDRSWGGGPLHVCPFPPFSMCAHHALPQLGTIRSNRNTETAQRTLPSSRHPSAIALPPLRN